MNRIWKLVVEVLVEPGDMPSGLTKGFMNVMTWANSADLAANKLAKYIEGFNWKLISIEKACPVDDNTTYDDEEMADMIERTRMNANAIILGTLHGYRES